MSCVSGAEMWVLEETEKFIFVKRFIKSHSGQIKTK